MKPFSCTSHMLFLTFHFPGHKNWVLCIAWSPDGKHLVSGSKSGELILWDPKTGNQLGTPLMVQSCIVQFLSSRPAEQRI
jgi:ribosome assembly protein 4